MSTFFLAITQSILTLRVLWGYFLYINFLLPTFYLKKTLSKYHLKKKRLYFLYKTPKLKKKYFPPISDPPGMPLPNFRPLGQKKNPGRPKFFLSTKKNEKCTDLLQTWWVARRPHSKNKVPLTLSSKSFLDTIDTFFSYFWPFFWP